MKVFIQIPCLDEETTLPAVLESIPTEIDARVTCNRGSQRIIHTYQQNIE